MKCADVCCILAAECENELCFCAEVCFLLGSRINHPEITLSHVNLLKGVSGRAVECETDKESGVVLTRLTRKTEGRG